MEALEAAAPEHTGASVRTRIRQLLDQFTDLEFTDLRAFAALAVIYVASRVPWLDLGYGTDPDAWRVALSAHHLWSANEYFPSRLPGSPLHEFVTAAVIKQGWVWTNLSTLLISLAGVYLFARVARELELPHRGVLTLAFAFAPFLWINSVMTIDYMWALTFLLAAYLALLRREPTLAGVALGIAAGFRLTSLAMLLPFLLLLWRSGRRDEFLTLARTSMTVTLLVYIPVLTVYGIKFLNFYDQSVSAGVVIRQLGKDGLGVIGALAVLAALALSFQRLRRLPGDLLRDPHVLTWSAVVVVFFLLYGRLPHEVAFLIPVFPFGYFLLSRYLSRGLLVAALAVVVLAGFVDVTANGGTLDIEMSTVTDTRIGKGMLLTDIDTLQDQRDFARELRELTTNGEQVKTPAVVVTGSIYPQFAVRFRDELALGILDEDEEAISQLSDLGLAVDVERSIEYVWLLDRERFDQLKEEGKNLYFTADAARRALALFGYRPSSLGAFELPLSREEPPPGEGTAPTDR